MSEERSAEETVQSVRAHGRPGFVEPRWPVALTVLTFIGITITLRLTVSDHESLGPNWLVPSVEIAMLVALLLADPTRIVSRRAWLRPVSLGLVVILAAAVFLSTFKLIRDLIEGGRVTDSATALLAAGALVWMGNCLIFGLLYWLLDSGGPTARYRDERQYPDFAFSQQLSPELAPPGWRPIYVDYLILGLTTSTAFSPTDVMPMSSWAKLMMAAQSLISLFVVGLVIARAVNIFG
jgi:uncharacterized membrane protein